MSIPHKVFGQQPSRELMTRQKSGAQAVTLHHCRNGPQFQPGFFPMNLKATTRADRRNGRRRILPYHPNQRFFDTTSFLYVRHDQPRRHRKPHLLPEKGPRKKRSIFLYSGHTVPILAGFLAVTYAEKTICSVPSPRFQLLIICSLLSFFVIEMASKPSPFRIRLTLSGEIAPAIQPV